jgi:hypothetical protein
MSTICIRSPNVSEGSKVADQASGCRTLKCGIGAEYRALPRIRKTDFLLSQGQVRMACVLAPQSHPDSHPATPFAVRCSSRKVRNRQICSDFAISSQVAENSRRRA